MVIFNALQTSLNGGIGRYSYELAKELYKNNSDIKIVIRNQDLKLFDFVGKQDLIIANNINNSKDRNIYEQFKLPNIIYKKYPEAIIHYPDTMAPLFSKNKVVITVHDLAFKSLKKIFTWKTTVWKNIITNLSIKKADKIIAITNFTKDEILKHYPNIDKNKISVVHNGFNDFSKDEIKKENISDKIRNINKKYILIVSTISPRKNIDGLIKAFNKIKDDIDENLIIAGNKGWMCEAIYKLVDDIKLNDRVVFTGKINDDELKYLYKNASVFTYVSFYEGFGLPPLEAMSYGIPCIVSNTSSIPEVVGDAAIKVDPKNVGEISKYIKNLILDKDKNLIEKGKERIKKFSWQKCAKETFDSYWKILK
ncbi:glycosyltransferase family 1 protein [Clostridium botulinum]|uniref:glycosyltransferase family 4 protein n=1 Tax=Clostridium botulinum TaxID=1491 RepID=UPI00217EBB34|nr:glycosyltransferase family 1 protein [Clostridium botulinum]MCS6104935.1 glycosyltransferase family 1 protein [Clostridium botulinum]MCS6108284.1 glycosyltransferase family 1 protein [Clostridium botulinum]